MLSAAQLQLRKCTFELRYEQCYALWDNAGKLWTRFLQEYPGAKPTDEVSPNVTRFVIDGKYIVSAQLDRSFVLVQDDKVDRKTFLEMATFFGTLVVDTLGIQELTRVAVRPVFQMTVKDASEASGLLLQSGLVGNPSCPIPMDSVTVSKATSSWHWKEKSVELILRIQSDEQRIQSKPTPGLPPEIAKALSLDERRNYLTVDMDYMVNARVSRGKLDIKEWLMGALSRVDDGLVKLLPKAGEGKAP